MMRWVYIIGVALIVCLVGFSWGYLWGTFRPNAPTWAVVITGGSVCLGVIAWLTQPTWPGDADDG